MNARPEADDIHGYYFEDQPVGMTASYAKPTIETDIVLLAGISGDVNSVHLNAEFATRTILEGRIEDGVLTASLISTVLGTKPPGPNYIYLRQDLWFLAPVRPGDTVQSQITITDVNVQKERIFALTVCRVGDTSVVEGRTNLFVPNQRKADTA